MLSKKALWLIPIVTLFILIGFFFFRSPKVDYFHLEPIDIKETLITVGRIEPAQKIQLAFQVSGIIQNTFFAEGDQVKQGDLIIELERKSEENYLKQKKTNLDLAYNSLDGQKRIEYQTALEDYTQSSLDEKQKDQEHLRNKALFDSGVISGIQLQDSQYSYETVLSRKKTAQVRLESLEKEGTARQETMLNIRRAQLELDEATLKLEKKSINSPINGIISTLDKIPGEYVQQGEVVLSLMGNTTIVKAEIDEKELYQIKAGLEAKVSLLAQPEKVFSAQVKAVSPEIDPQKGIIEVDVKVLDEQFPHYPYAAVNVEIVTSDEKQAWALPKDFVIQAGDKDYIWLYQDGSIVKKEITVVKELDQWVIINPLEKPSDILLPGSYKEGQKVKLNQERRE